MFSSRERGYSFPVTLFFRLQERGVGWGGGRGGPVGEGVTAENGVWQGRKTGEGQGAMEDWGGENEEVRCAWNRTVSFVRAGTTWHLCSHVQTQGRAWQTPDVR